MTHIYLSPPDGKILAILARFKTETPRIVRTILEYDHRLSVEPVLELYHLIIEGFHSPDKIQASEMLNQHYDAAAFSINVLATAPYQLVTSEPAPNGEDAVRHENDGSHDVIPFEYRTSPMTLKEGAKLFGVKAAPKKLSSAMRRFLQASHYAHIQLDRRRHIFDKRQIPLGGKTTVETPQSTRLVSR